MMRMHSIFRHLFANTVAMAAVDVNRGAAMTPTFRIALAPADTTRGGNGSFSSTARAMMAPEGLGRGARKVDGVAREGYGGIEAIVAQDGETNVEIDAIVIERA